MSWTRDELREWVQARIDELSPLEQSTVIPGNIIERELDESANQVLRKAKKQLVYSVGEEYAPSMCYGAVKKGIDGLYHPYSLYIPLPEDFIRFIRLRLLGWNRPVDDIVSVDSNQYRHQFNTFQSSTKNNPSCALSPFSVDVSYQYTRTVGEVSTTTTVTVPPFAQAIEAAPIPEDITHPASTLEATIIRASQSSSESIGTNNVDYRTVEVLAEDYEGADAIENDDIIEARDLAGLNTAVRRGMIGIFTDYLLDEQKSPIVECTIIRKKAAEELPDSLIDPMVWLASGRCLTMLRNPGLAQAAYQNYQLSLDQLLIGMKGEEVAVGHIPKQG